MFFNKSLNNLSNYKQLKKSIIEKLEIGKDVLPIHIAQTVQNQFLLGALVEKLFKNSECITNTCKE